MRVTRIQFDDSEPSESVARRIAVAFDPGNIMKIRDKFFRMSPNRSVNQTSASNVVGDKYTLIIRPGEPVPAELLVVQAPPPVPKPKAVQQKEPENKESEDEGLDSTPTQELGSVPPPAASEVCSSQPPKGPLDHSVASREVLEAARTSVKMEVGPGQVWQSKDSRRQSTPFTITNVDHEFAYQDNGRKIALNRMSRYRRMS